jgi:DNA helicase-2/ATP-dependent DNA helicase PcrA
MDKLELYSGNTGQPLWNILTNPALANIGFHAGTIKKLKKFTDMIAGFRELLNKLSAYDIAVEIATGSGMRKIFQTDTSIEGQSKLENIEELLNGLKEFSEEKAEEGKEYRLVDFLEEVSLLTDQDTDKEEDKNKITLMTIHSAKGLEFKYVYIVGVEEGLFPSPMAMESVKGLEEERRLFYVAVTRAKEQVTISFAKQRYKYGELTFSKPSRFIAEIDQQYLDLKGDNILPKFRSKQTSQTSSFKARNSGGFSPQKPAFNYKKVDREKASKSSFGTGNTGNYGIKEGMNVLHERFGKGKVLSVTGQAPNTKATVLFDNAGEKQLLLKFAKIKILS